MADPIRRDDRRYTYRDYASWPDGERWELIDGVAYSMSPAPTTNHQRQVGELYFSLRRWIERHGSPCEAIVSPIDVFLPADPSQSDQDVDTVVQPDVIVVCDPAKVTPRGCRGAPDLVVEVLSPSTSHRDQIVKHKLYARHGVREFWVVDPGNRCIRVYRPDPAAKPRRFGEPAILHEEGCADSAVLPGFTLPLLELFARLG